MSRYIRNLLIALAVLAIVYGLNFVFAGRMVSPYLSRMLMLCGIEITMAVSLNLIIGFTGQFSIEHAGFMSVEVYSDSKFSFYFHGRISTAPDGGDTVWLV